MTVIISKKDLETSTKKKKKGAVTILNIFFLNIVLVSIPSDQF